MPRVILDGTADAWRAHARALAASGTPPDEIDWVDLLRGGASDATLFAAPEVSPLPPRPHVDLPVPRAFGARVGTVACHRSSAIWPLLYGLLVRMIAGERRLLDDPLDAEVATFARLEKAVRRDAHKMHAFVRFRRVEDPLARNGERFIAWYEPSHLIVEREAPFFRERFPSMDWSILSPDRCAHWDGARVTFTEGVTRERAPDHDELEEMWCSYYASIFNPARVKLKAMAAEMPRKFWSTLPETAQLPELLEDVPRRLEAMARTSRRMADSAHPFVPPGAGLDELRAALPGCEGCELHRDSTRPVMGEGPADARVVLLGEQPGDAEERQGRPFIGPAGAILREAMAQASMGVEGVYLTNAVKHFRHELAALSPGEEEARQQGALAVDPASEAPAEPSAEPSAGHSAESPAGLSDGVPAGLPAGPATGPDSGVGLGAATGTGTGRGRRRIHQRPTAQHASRCQPWLDAEMQVVQPEVLVTLGATAMRAVHGPTARLPDPLSSPAAAPSRYARITLATFHPAAILRATDGARRSGMLAHLVATLRRAREDIGDQEPSGTAMRSEHGVAELGGPRNGR